MTAGAGFDSVAAQAALYSSKNPTRRWLHSARKAWVLNAVRNHASVDRSRALEIGPGAGIYLPSLVSSWERVTAFDRELAFLKHAKGQVREANLELVVGDIAQSGLRTGGFQLIICSEVIEHVPDPVSALHELHRLLATRGVLILTTPQRFSSLEQLSRIAYLPGVIRLARWVYGEPIWDDGHISLMTEAELRRLFIEVGLEVLEEHMMGAYIPLVAEFGGALGVRVAKTLERRMQSGVLDWLLWTQCYVLTK
jgi:2-polyprenyl-3-methyl-5-hydroxy-6-metoxy-1,4-benzoquinol methylase